jgi:hypothetical protein
LERDAMRKYLLFGFCLLLGLGATAQVILQHRRAVPSSPLEEKNAEAKDGKRINKDNFEKIQTGMTEQEVEAILGPAGIYTARDTYHYTPPLPSVGLRWKRSVEDCLKDDERIPNKGRKTWYGDAAFITIYFDFQGRVTEWGYAGGKYFDRAYLASDVDPYPDGR